MTLIVSICMALVIGFCCGRVSITETTEVKRLTNLYQDKSNECEETKVVLEQTKSELATVKRKLGGIINALTNLTK